jgi:hypothetical protein
VLAKQVLYCLNLISSLFCFGYFSRWGSHEQFAWAGPLILLITASQVARIEVLVRGCIFIFTDEICIYFAKV